MTPMEQHYSKHKKKLLLCLKKMKTQMNLNLPKKHLQGEVVTLTKMKRKRRLIPRMMVWKKVAKCLLTLPLSLKFGKVD